MIFYDVYYHYFAYSIELVKCMRLVILLCGINEYYKNLKGKINERDTRIILQSSHSEFLFRRQK